jgi:hypothetical protein
MNIFVTDPNPYVSAASLDDARVVKMVLESVQMICTYAHLEGHTVPYKPTHQNNGLIRWLQNDKNNFYWLMAHAYGLASEYRERYKRTHASEDVLWDLCTIYGYEKGTPIAFLNKAKSLEHDMDYTHIQDVFTAYRLYLDARWNKAIRDHALNPRKRLPKWTGVKPPDWYTVEEI